MTSTLYRFFVGLIVISLSPFLQAQSFATQHWQTSNGTQVIFYQAMEVPMLDISMAFAAGSAYDGQQFGLSRLTSQLLNQGNQGLSATEIAQKIEDTGAQFNAETNRDMLIVSLRTLTSPENMKQAVEALSLIITHPDFPESTFMQEKNQQLIAIKQAQESPDEVANQAFYQALYQDHPYAHSVLGDTAHVGALTNADVRQFYHRYFVGKNAVLVLVGAIDSATAHQIAEQINHDLPEGQTVAPIPRATPLEKDKMINLPFSSSQTVLRLGQMGITHHDPRYFSFLVGNYILGGGSMVSNLALELREKRGLTYGVSSQFLPLPGVGPFIIGLSTRNNQAALAEKLIRETVADFVNNGPTTQQLQDAKQFLTGGFPLSLASNRNIADILLKINFYHLPENYLDTYISNINAVTLDAIKRDFQALIKPKTLLQVNVGQQ